MGLMAGIASDPARVVHSHNLRKGFRLGGVGFMAARADDGCVELWRFHRGRIVGVTALGPVAGFAGHYDVLTEFLLIDYIGMTAFAYVVTGERDRPGCDIVKGGGAVVPVFAEGLWNDSNANCRESDQGNHQDRS